MTLAYDPTHHTVVVDEDGHAERTLAVTARTGGERDEHHRRRRDDSGTHLTLAGRTSDYDLRAEVEVEHGRVHGEVEIRDGARYHAEYHMDGKKASGLYYVHTDQLGTPRAVSDSVTGKVVWRWGGEPFGANAPNERPDGDGVNFVFNLRFPGQYFDVETGLSYNYYRYYDPIIGRYVTSDPSGLAGGLNTYGYVNANPTTYMDPLGLGWQYSQHTHTLREYDNSTGKQIPNTTDSGGYSGKEKGLNNPAMQGKRSVGPIPQGLWKIGSPYHNKHTGPYTMNLTPLPGTNTFGRNLFRIHGNNAAQNNTASEGCIVEKRSTRTRIWNSGDHLLRVVP